MKRGFVAFYNPKTKVRASREIAQNEEGEEVEYEGIRVGWPIGSDQPIVSEVANTPTAARGITWLDTGTYRRLNGQLVSFFERASDALFWLDRQSADDVRRAEILDVIREALGQQTDSSIDQTALTDRIFQRDRLPAPTRNVAVA